VGRLNGWKHCPRCGNDLGGDQRSLRCDVCGSHYYASSAPAAAAIVVDDVGRVLLGRRAVEPDIGKWDTPGGFLDEGERPEDALRRELLEETGLEVEPGRFLGAFVDTYGEGPEVGSVLNLVWEAKVVSGEMEPADDVSELRWFAPDELPEPDDEYAFHWVAPFFRKWARSRTTSKG
jgi:ADP-ribose pyrophosphatase YjhB (NUDIX family)